MRHLDKEYKNRWEEFHLEDGTVEDSREKNWRDVAWDKVVKIDAHVRGHVHSISRNECPEFKAFMNFRWAGFRSTFDNLGRCKGTKAIDMWSIGWTDGKLCFYKCIDFKTGRLVGETEAPIMNFVEHIHPAVKGRVLGIE